MLYKLDSELRVALEGFASGATPVPLISRGDWAGLRAGRQPVMEQIAALAPEGAGVRTATFNTPSCDGAAIELRWYERVQGSRGSAVVYAHGGGMIMGSLDDYERLLSWYVEKTGVPFLSVGYRLAPEATQDSVTTLAEDVFAGLSWLHEHAADRGVDRDRIAVMGDSGGGAPAAGAAILARDRGLPLAMQILVYPMLDDRNQAAETGPPYLTWNYDDNYTAWLAVLGARFGTDDVPAVAAPARLVNLAGLPPTYLDVGDLDIFRDEGIAYAQRLARAGVPIELHVHAGAPHGWERVAPDTGVAKRAMSDRVRVIAGL